MRYEVKSNRLQWAQGAALSASELSGCNIAALIAGGHLAPVSAATPDEQKKMSKRTPVEPVPDDTAEEPEEQQ